MLSKNLEISLTTGHLSTILEKPKGKIKGSVIIMHGRRSNKNREGYLDIIQIAHKNNFQTVRFDFRGHGDSYDSPNWNNYGIIDQYEDIVTVIKYLKNNGLLKEKVILVPSSFSSDPVLIYAAKHSGVNTIILHSPGIGKNSANAPDNRYRKNWWDNNISITQIPFSEYKQLLKQIDIPIHSLHGDNDESVPIEQSQELQGLIGGNFRLHTIKDGKHKYTQPPQAMQQRQEIINNLLSEIK